MVFREDHDFFGLGLFAGWGVWWRPSEKRKRLANHVDFLTFFQHPKWFSQGKQCVLLTPSTIDLAGPKMGPKGPFWAQKWARRAHFGPQMGPLGTFWARLADFFLGGAFKRPYEHRLRKDFLLDPLQSPAGGLG